MPACVSTFLRDIVEQNQAEVNMRAKQHLATQSGNQMLRHYR
jgi:hypothetical protein